MKIFDNSLFSFVQMYTIMFKHSSNLIESLHKKVGADEVIEVKEWVMLSCVQTCTELPSSREDVCLITNVGISCLFYRVFGPYSMDVVTSTAFSVDIDSINHPSDPFVTNIKRMVKFNFLNPLLMLVGMLNIILWPEYLFCRLSLTFKLTVSLLIPFSSVSILETSLW